MAPLKIQNMFGLAAKRCTDPAKREVLYSTIRDMIMNRDTSLPNNTDMDTLFKQREQLKATIKRIHNVPGLDQENADHVDEIFKLSGHLNPTVCKSRESRAPALIKKDVPPMDIDSMPSVKQPSVKQPSVKQCAKPNVLEIQAEGFDSIVICLPNGKKLTIKV